MGFSLEASARYLFSLVQSGSHSVELYLNHLLDREVASSYAFQIFAIDRGSPALLGETTVFITVRVSPTEILIAYSIIASRQCFVVTNKTVDYKQTSAFEYL